MSYMLPQPSLRGIHTPVRSLPLRHSQVHPRPQHEDWPDVQTPYRIMATFKLSTISGFLPYYLFWAIYWATDITYRPLLMLANMQIQVELKVFTFLKATGQDDSAALFICPVQNIFQLLVKGFNVVQQYRFRSIIDIC